MTPLFVVRRIVCSRGHAGFSLQNLMANIPLFQDFSNRLVCNYGSDTIWDLFPFTYSSFFFLFIHLSCNTSIPTSFLSAPSSLIQGSSISLQKRACFPGIATERGITRCSKTVCASSLLSDKDSVSQKSASPLIKVRINTTSYAHWLSPAEKMVLSMQDEGAQEPVPTCVIKPPFPPHFSVRGTAAVFDIKKPKISNF